MNQILRRFSKFRLVHDTAFHGAVESIFEICAAKAQAPAVFFVPAPRLFPFSDAGARGQDRAALPESVPACSGAQNCVRRERISLPVMNSVSSSSGSVRFRFAGSSKIRVLRFLRDQPEKKRRPAGRRCPWQGSCPAAFCLRAHPHGRLDRRWLSTCFQGLCGSQVHCRTLRFPKSMRKLPVSFFAFITLSPSTLPSFGYTFLPSVRKRVPFLI